MENNQEQKEQEFKFIIIGGNEPSLNKEILESIEKSGASVAIFEMTLDEMKFVINSRAQKKAEEMSVDYINNPEHIERCKSWVKTIIEAHVKHNYTPKVGVPLLLEILEGRQRLELNKKQFKLASKLSWKDSTELLGTLELYGFVIHTDTHGGLFSLVISEDPKDVFNNKIKDLRELINLSIGKATVLFKDTAATPEQKKALKSTKTRLSNVVETL